jgi:hypothetical protein
MKLQSLSPEALWWLAARQGLRQMPTIVAAEWQVEDERTRFRSADGMTAGDGLLVYFVGLAKMLAGSQGGQAAALFEQEASIFGGKAGPATGTLFMQAEKAQHAGEEGDRYFYSRYAVLKILESRGNSGGLMEEGLDCGRKATRHLDSSVEQEDRVLAAADLLNIARPLWGTNPPKAVGAEWAHAVGKLRLRSEGWEPWIDWYGQLLAGSSQPLLARIAQLPGDEAIGEPRIVNARLAQ